MSKIQNAIGNIKGRSRKTQSRVDEMRENVDIDNTSSLAVLNPVLLAKAKKIQVDESSFRNSKILSHKSNQRHSAEGAYRMLRTRVMRSMRSNNWRILGVSACGQNEGKTYTAINLAISVAAEVDQEVVLIDLDLRRPSVYRCLGVDPDDIVDLSEYFTDESLDIQSLLVRSENERLACILSADSMERPSDVLASARGRLLFDELRERLGPDVIVIVDLPPLLAADDALAVAPMLDAFLLVVAEGQAERDDVSEIRTILEDFNHIGTVLNKSVEKDSKRANYY